MTPTGETVSILTDRCPVFSFTSALSKNNKQLFILTLTSHSELTNRPPTSHEIRLTKKICHESSRDMKVVLYDEPHNQNQFIKIVTSLEKYFVWSPV